MNLKIMIFRKKELVLLATILIAGAIGFIGFNYNYGYILIETNLTDLEIQAGKKIFQCQNNQECKIQLTPKNYTVLIKKEGYNDFEVKTEVKRNITTKLTYTPVLTPTFKPYSQSADPLFSAELVNVNNQTQYKVNGQLITTFPQPLSSSAVAIVSADGFRGLVYEPTQLPEVYLVNVTEKSKELILLDLDFLPFEISFIDLETLLIKDESKVISYNLESKIQNSFPIVSVEHFVCVSEIECLFISPFDIKDEANEVNSDLNLFAEIVTEKGLDFFTAQDLEYKLYLLNKETEQISLIQKLPNFIVNPKAIFLSVNNQTSELVRLIQSDSGRLYQIIF